MLQVSRCRAANAADFTPTGARETRSAGESPLLPRALTADKADGAKLREQLIKNK